MSKLNEYLEVVINGDSLGRGGLAVPNDLIKRLKFFLDRHDWTFEMSDDNRSYTYGHDNLQKIMNTIREIKKSDLSDELKKKAEKMYDKEKKQAHPKISNWDKI